MATAIIILIAQLVHRLKSVHIQRNHAFIFCVTFLFCGPSISGQILVFDGIRSKTGIVTAAAIGGGDVGLRKALGCQK